MMKLIDACCSIAVVCSALQFATGCGEGAPFYVDPEGTGGDATTNYSDGTSGSHAVDCQLLDESRCEPSGCAAMRMKQLKATPDGWCYPLEDVKGDGCYDPDDDRECSGGDLVTYWQNRNGDVFQSPVDCGPPGYERVNVSADPCE